MKNGELREALAIQRAENNKVAHSETAKSVPLKYNRRTDCIKNVLVELSKHNPIKPSKKIIKDLKTQDFMRSPMAALFKLPRKK